MEGNIEHHFVAWKQEKKINGVELEDEAIEKIQLIHDGLKDIQDRQKKYYDAKHHPVEFDVLRTKKKERSVRSH